ncbi:MAG: metallophosphoesterase [Lachnospiraceae bacterium]|nr:metallophosphoesterase [Lachnospiraceae bacterium]
MKKVLVISDNHGRTELMYELVGLVKPVDLIVHCGDVEVPNIERRLSERADCPVHVVSGNNDYFGGYPFVDIFMLGEHRVLLTHGHKQKLYYDLTNLFYLAAQEQADIVLFGHLHTPIIQREGEVLLVNPGSLTYPRQSNGLPSYAMLTLEDDGTVRAAIRYIKRTRDGLEILPD